MIKMGLVHSILGPGGGGAFDTFMIIRPNFLHCDWLEYSIWNGEGEANQSWFSM